MRTATATKATERKSASDRNLSLREAAERLGVSPLTLRHWAKYQRRVSYLRLGRRIVFRVSDLEAFEKASRVAAREDAGR
jgi:excisionase family DNA binding protein